jgi:xanthine dehydrogenase YagT iron-sulfur-binding subunit
MDAHMTPRPKDEAWIDVCGGPAVSRRSLLSGGAAILPLLSIGTARAAPERSDPRAPVGVALQVNGHEYRLQLDARTTLLDMLREHLGLTGAKKGCDHGQCGACTVHIGEDRVLACMTLAAAVRGPVTTIEGLAGPDGRLHPMQQAFIDQDAFQCGYCTPGQILSAIACVREGHASSDAEIREYMSGNLCRCAAYTHIVKAVAQAKARMGAV